MIYPLPPSMGQSGVIFIWNILGGPRKPYTGSLERQSDLPPAPLHPYESNWGKKNQRFCVFGSYHLYYCCIACAHLFLTLHTFCLLDVRYQDSKIID